ncbi:MAG: hypothetical protein OXF54_21980, partial [Caldilineaceae bacterium]|nr:hypothetical protein [Caldilineaceae bacterium]
HWLSVKSVGYRFVFTKTTYPTIWPTAFTFQTTSQYTTHRQPSRESIRIPQILIQTTKKAISQARSRSLKTKN